MQNIIPFAVWFHWWKIDIPCKIIHCHACWIHWEARHCMCWGVLFSLVEGDVKYWINYAIALFIWISSQGGVVKARAYVWYQPMCPWSLKHWIWDFWMGDSPLPELMMKHWLTQMYTLPNLNGSFKSFGMFVVIDMDHAPSILIGWMPSLTNSKSHYLSIVFEAEINRFSARMNEYLTVLDWLKYIKCMRK